jgi:hypothetical protein
MLTPTIIGRTDNGHAHFPEKMAMAIPADAG